MKKQFRRLLSLLMVFSMFGTLTAPVTAEGMPETAADDTTAYEYAGIPEETAAAEQGLTFEAQTAPLYTEEGEAEETLRPVTRDGGQAT